MLSEHERSSGWGADAVLPASELAAASCATAEGESSIAGVSGAKLGASGSRPKLTRRGVPCARRGEAMRARPATGDCIRGDGGGGGSAPPPPPLMALGRVAVGESSGVARWSKARLDWRAAGLGLVAAAMAPAAATPSAVASAVAATAAATAASTTASVSSRCGLEAALCVPLPGSGAMATSGRRPSGCDDADPSKCRRWVDEPRCADAPAAP